MTRHDAPWPQSRPVASQRGFVIRTLDDLGKVHEALGNGSWLHVAIEDRAGRAYILAEHENGELYVNCGDEDGWTDAESLVRSHSPLTVLSEIVFAS
jgi:hypothetical protein